MSSTKQKEVICSTRNRGWCHLNIVQESQTMTRRCDAPINMDYYLFIYFHVMFKKSQMSFIGVVPEPKSQMAQA